MQYIKLFVSLVYWGLLARLYIAAGNYRQWYECSRSPLTVLGGGREWRVNTKGLSQIEIAEYMCKKYGRNWQNVANEYRVFDSVETLLAEATEEGWPV